MKHIDLEPYCYECRKRFNTLHGLFTHIGFIHSKKGSRLG